MVAPAFFGRVDISLRVVKSIKRTGNMQSDVFTLQ